MDTSHISMTTAECLMRIASRVLINDGPLAAPPLDGTRGYRIDATEWEQAG